MNVWWKRFRENLGFWSVHCVISALPGFCIAMWFLKLSENPVAPLAMLAALVTFILILTALASLSGTLTGWQTLPSRGLRFGLQVRAISSGASLMVIAVIMANGGDYENPVTFVMPDMWTGAAATIIPSIVAEDLGIKNPIGQFMDQETDLSFIMVYTIAMIDGLILSFIIFIVSFVSMLVLQMRDRRGMYGRRSQPVAAILAAAGRAGTVSPSRPDLWVRSSGDMQTTLSLVCIQHPGREDSTVSVDCAPPFPGRLGTPCCDSSTSKSAKHTPHGLRQRPSLPFAQADGFGRDPSIEGRR